MKIRKAILVYLLTGFFFPEFSQEQSPKIGLSGMLRFRQFYYQSESNVPGYLDGSGLNEANYTDLFYRNRIDVNVSPIIHIFSVFDVYVIFGEDLGQISSDDIGFQLRNVYAEIEMFKSGKFNAGYMTYTLPEGIILATNGAGIKYEHSFFKNLFVPYLFWIKAYDNSRDVVTDGIGGNNLKDNDILIGGLKLNPPGNNLNFDFFYILNYDKEDSYDPEKKLHWAGLNSSFLIKNSKINFLTIYNNGEVYTSNKVNISSLLLRLAFSFEKILGLNKIMISAIVEGSSGSPGDAFTPDRFMNINPSHGVNNIAVDNTAAISIFPAGDFHGIVNSSILAGLNFKSIELKIIYSHIRLVNNFLTPESNFGNEFDFNVNMDLGKSIQVYVQSGIFFPEDGYHSIDPASNDPITEITAGAIFKY
jgi:hypothetical protein